MDPDLIAALLRNAIEWCEAVERDSSWDGWDHHYKSMCRLLPHLGLEVRGEAASEENYGQLAPETEARIREIVAGFHTV